MIMKNIDSLTWRRISSDSLLLCQFMMGYEVRADDYLVALDQQQNIVAAGQLFHRSNTDAELELVVAPRHRVAGIGRELVRRLIIEANHLLLQRLIGHGDKGFWLKLGFLQTAGNDFALLLPQAREALQQTWHRGIPMTDYMALSIAYATPSALETHSNLAASINVHQTMFAGAIYSQAVLTGWGLVHLALQCAGLTGSIVLAEGNIRYRKPLSQNPRGVVEQTIDMVNLLPLIENEKVSLELEVKMFCDRQPHAAAIFSGRYVIIPAV